MSERREQLLNRMGKLYVLSAVVGFLAWAVYAVTCTNVSAHDWRDGYAAGMEDYANMEED